MKVLKVEDAILTDCEVLDFLRESRAEKQALVKQGFPGSEAYEPVPVSEIIQLRTMKYLETLPAGSQKRSDVGNLFSELRNHDFRLSPMEMMQLANHRPTNMVQLLVLVKDCERRFSPDEIAKILEIVQTLLPPPPVIEADEAEEFAEGDHGEQEGRTVESMYENQPFSAPGYGLPDGEDFAGENPVQEPSEGAAAELEPATYDNADDNPDEDNELVNNPYERYDDDLGNDSS